ncbi:MAG TPA: agmatine deiminase family protein [Candidatus Thermoplasmatota archaeon]|jgi:agmatine deiminase|nr:agmatine deiminase family protein [Candidatus Thermoplasmatota archaeon]
MRRAQHAPKGPSPSSQGYQMPAEWELQQATWLAWPHDPLTWPDRLAQAQAAYETMIRALARTQRVDLLVDPGDEAAAVRKRLAGVPNLALHEVAHADSWIRDYGPTFVVRGEPGQRQLAFVDWIFNAWGDKYETLLPDDAICGKLEPILAMPRFEPGIVMEGGAIDVDGQGTLLTTEQCLLNPNRNPLLGRAQIETVLRDYLGTRKVLWLGEGIAGDDTDGHVDDIARFAAPGVVLAAMEPDGDSPNHAPLQENLKRLRGMTDALGRPLHVLEMPMPSWVEDGDGKALPASYLNFLIANGVVLMPAFEEPRDAEAERVLARAFPGRAVVRVPARDLVWGMGTVHCLSQQMPAP